MKSIADLEQLIRKQDLDYKPKETPQLVMEDALIGSASPVKRSSFHGSVYGRRAILIGLAVILAILTTAIVLHTDEPLSPKAEALRVGVFMPLCIFFGSVLSSSVLLLLQRVFSSMFLYCLSGFTILIEIIWLAAN